jgi:hypothetical protein
VQLPEPSLEVVGHRRDCGEVGCGHGRRADEVGPEPGLNLKVGTSQVE